MTARFRKKNSRQRGSHTHGYGAKKKHRGGGSRGGRGFGGTHKHKFSWVLRWDPDHFGYKGFHSRRAQRQAINVSDLERLNAGSDVNLPSLGYHTLLGRGSVTKAFVVTVDKCSARARHKIETAGGRIVSP